MHCKYSIGVCSSESRTNIRKASTDPVHGYSEPVSIDTDVASDTSEQVDGPSSPNSSGTEQVEEPEHVNPEHHASPEIVLRRSSRNRRLPSRLKEYVMNISWTLAYLWDIKTWSTLRNIAAVESRPTSATLRATNFFVYPPSAAFRAIVWCKFQCSANQISHSNLTADLISQPLTQTRRFLLLMRAFSSPSKSINARTPIAFFFAKRRHFGLRDVNIIAWELGNRWSSIARNVARNVATV